MHCCIGCMQGSKLNHKTSFGQYHYSHLCAVHTFSSVETILWFQRLGSCNKFYCCLFMCTVLIWWHNESPNFGHRWDWLFTGVHGPGARSKSEAFYHVRDWETTLGTSREGRDSFSYFMRPAEWFHCGMMNDRMNILNVQ